MRKERGNNNQERKMNGNIEYMLLYLGASLYSSVGKESVCNAGDLGLIPGLESSPGEGNGNPVRYSCLENPMDREPGREPGRLSMGSQELDTT